MKTLIQPFATVVLAGATFVLGQNNPVQYSKEIRTRALVIVDGDGNEAGRFASLDNITTLSMTPLGKPIVQMQARDKEFHAGFGAEGGGIVLRSSGTVSNLGMTASRGGGQPTTSF